MAMPENNNNNNKEHDQSCVLRLLVVHGGIYLNIETKYIFYFLFSKKKKITILEKINYINLMFNSIFKQRLK